MDVEKVIEEIKQQAIARPETEYVEGLMTANNIIKKHQDDKVVWPKYVIHDWEAWRNSKSLDQLVYGFIGGLYTCPETDDWFIDEKNIKTFFKGILYGYAMEKEKKYRVPMPHATNQGGNPVYVGLYNGNLLIAANQTSEGWKQQFTKEEADKLPEPYRSLGREEVEDDE